MVAAAFGDDMSIDSYDKAGLGKVARLCIRCSVSFLLIGAGLLSLTACGGSPMTVERRYSEPKSQEQILDDKVAAARRAERAHGAL